MKETTEIEIDCVWTTTVPVKKGDVVVVRDGLGKEMHCTDPAGKESTGVTVSVGASGGATLGAHIRRVRDRDAEQTLTLAGWVKAVSSCKACAAHATCGGVFRKGSAECVEQLRGYIIEAAQKGGVE